MRWSTRVKGLENVPVEGPAIVASNHIGLLDWVFIGRATVNRGRLVRFMGKKEAFDHWLGGPLLRSMHHIPVDRFGDAAGAITPAVDALRRGEVIGIFPEGTLSRSFVPSEGRTGAARIAFATGAPLLPVAIWGSHRILTAGHVAGVLRRNVAILISFGPPLPYERDEDPDAVTERLMAAIRTLFDEVVAAYPQQPRGSRDRWWVPAHLGGTATTVAESNRLAEAFRARRRALRQLRDRVRRKP
jgi:1-acyl-sn-glycerol-3-phosphate acyltransferase